VSVRSLSFLGDCAAPHHAAIAAALRCGPLERPGLDALETVVADASPALLFICGLPYVRLRDRGLPLELLAAPVPTDGDGRAEYHAALVARPGLGTDVVDRLAGVRFAYNGRDSLSGWVLPLASFPELADAPAIRSGSHRRSLELLLAGEADVAAIDSTVLALEARADPRIAALPVAARTARAPSPPAVLLHGSGRLAAILRGRLLRLSSTTAGGRALALGLVERYAAIEDDAYDAVRRLDGAPGELGIDDHDRARALAAP
jgi:ABC-type phosphate/phosphonate transport system substrate-binding protein